MKIAPESSNRRPVCIACTLPPRSALDARCAKLDLHSPCLARIVHRCFGYDNLPRRSAVVDEMTEHPPWSLLPPPALCKCAGLHSRFWQQPIHAATLRPESRPNAAYGREWCAPRSSMPASRALEELLAVASSSVIAHTGGLPWLCLQCRAVRCRLSSAVCATPIRWRRYGVSSFEKKRKKIQRGPRSLL